MHSQQSNIPMRPPAASGTTEELASMVINIGSSCVSVIFHSNSIISVVFIFKTKKYGWFLFSYRLNIPNWSPNTGKECILILGSTTMVPI